MTDEARKDYLSAIQCLKKLPTQENRDKYPGVRSRYDDFTIAHAINTGEVHRSPWLPVWHRQYTFAFETALRDECGYKYGETFHLRTRSLKTKTNTYKVIPTGIGPNTSAATPTPGQCSTTPKHPSRATARKPERNAPALHQDH